MKASALLKPIRFRFGDEADAKQFGDGWHLYDEAQIVRLPARELAKLEIELGMAILDVFHGMRRESVLGYLGGSWLALRLEDPDLAGSFDDYTPVAILIEWERRPAVKPAEDVAGPLEPVTSSDSPPVE